MRILALLKLGFSYSEALAMPQSEADAWIETYDEALHPEEHVQKKLVRRK